MKRIKGGIDEVIAYLDQNVGQLSEELTQQILEFMSIYNQKINFTELLLDYKPSYLININLAFIIQQRWKRQQFQDLTQNMEEIENAIKVIKDVRSDIRPEEEAGFFELMKFDLVLAKSYLQLATSYSQFGDHKKALYQGRQAIKFTSSVCQQIEVLLTK